MVEHNFNLPSSVYAKVSDISANPQIQEIKYDAYSDYHTMIMNDGWSWNFRVYKE